MVKRSRRWAVTIHDPSNHFLGHIDHLIETNDLTYYIVGKEKCPNTGRPHYQCFFIFVKKRVLQGVKNLLEVPSLHAETCKGSDEDNVTYCKKDGDYIEGGTVPHDNSGKRTDIMEFRDWLKEEYRSDLDICESKYFPLWLRYPRASNAARLLAPKHRLLPVGEMGRTLYPWQLKVMKGLESEPEDRKIGFIVDPVGNTGKTWLIKYIKDTKGESLILTVGKTNDLSYYIKSNGDKIIYLFSVPRGCMEFISYKLLESLKDGIIFSGKYESDMFVLKGKVHVLVFTNELPDLNKLSTDRYVIKQISNNKDLF